MLEHDDRAVLLLGDLSADCPVGEIPGKLYRGERVRLGSEQGHGTTHELHCSLQARKVRWGHLHDVSSQFKNKPMKTYQVDKTPRTSRTAP